MGNKDNQPKLKTKEYSLTNEELSELSFVRQQQRAAEEILNYWEQRWLRRLEKIKERLGLGADDHFDFRKLWTDGKLLAFHLPKPKVNPEEKNPAKQNEQELPKK